MEKEEIKKGKINKKQKKNKKRRKKLLVFKAFIFI